MKISTWSPEEVEEYEGICREARDAGDTTAERVERFIELIQHLEGSNAMWVRDVVRDIWRAGATAIFNRWLKRQEKPVAITYDGRTLSKPRMVGRKVQSASGQTVHQQVLFDLFTWEQLREKAAEYIRQITAYKGDLYTVTRLLELEAAAPGAATVHEALATIGVSMQEWFDAELREAS